MSDLVSVIMPCFNSSRFLAESIESVLKQTYENLELLIVDDASQDNSLEIAKKYSLNDERIRILRNNENLGPALTRNKGIKHAKGRYIAFLDSDDLWHPEKLQKQVGFMTETDTAMSHTSYEVMNVNGEKTRKIVHAKSFVTYKTLLLYNAIGCLTAMYDVQKTRGKQYGPDIPKRNDYALWLNILKKGYVSKGLDEVLAFYRVGQSTSISSKKLDLIKYHWRLFRGIEKLSIPRAAFSVASSAFLGYVKKLR
jgi:glycosyltransferase involved in cell wall biosynthesis